MTAVGKADEAETDSKSTAHRSSQQSGAKRDDANPRTRVEKLKAWRESLRHRPNANRIYRVVIGVVGAAIVVGGLALVPLPGPGWVIVFVGLALLGTEFTWAKRLNDFARRQVKAWTDWLGRQAWWVRALVGIATFVFVCCVLWALFAVSGVPGWVPDSWVPPLPGLT